jgi:hypothetical protein
LPPSGGESRVQDMEIEAYINRLAGDITVFEGLIYGVTDEQSRWQPAADKWAIVEVINHLYDEEIYDFRARLSSLLEDPDRKWPPIDPQNWAIAREYRKRDLQESFNKFKDERVASLEWLKSIKAPNWQHTYHHRQGEIKAGDLLISWAGHDLIHIRQITRLHWQYLNSISQPYSSQYAGPW